MMASFLTRLVRAGRELMGRSPAAENSVVRRTPMPTRRSLGRVRMGFDGARMDRLSMDWNEDGLSADDLASWGLPRIRRRCRDLELNDAEFRQWLRLLANGVVGPDGFLLRSNVEKRDGEPSDRVNHTIEKGWKLWASKPVTIDGRLPFVPFLRKAVKETARDGEILVRKWRGFSRNAFGFALESIDPELLDESFNVKRTKRSNVEIRCGVEVDELGAPVAYHIWDGPAGGMIDRKRVRIPADQIIHLYDHERANQNRGVPWAQSIMMPLHHLGAYFDYELAASRTNSSQLGWLEDIPGGLPGSVLTPPAPNTDPEGAGTTETTWGLPSSGAGPDLELEVNGISINQAPTGKTFKGWEPNHPTSQFGPFVKEIRRRNAAGVGVSYTSHSGDLESVNLSSIRYGVEPERDEYVYRQNWLVQTLVQPLFEEWLAWSLLTGAVVLPSLDPAKYANDVTWQGRRWKYMNPLEEVQADALAIRHALNSHQGVVGEHGGEFVEIAKQVAKERKLKEKLGIPLDPDLTTSKVSNTTAGDEEKDDTDKAKKKKADDDDGDKNGSRSGRLGSLVHA